MSDRAAVDRKANESLILRLKTHAKKTHVKDLWPFWQVEPYDTAAKGRAVGESIIGSRKSAAGFVWEWALRPKRRWRSVRDLRSIRRSGPRLFEGWHPRL